MRVLPSGIHHEIRSSNRTARSLARAISLRNFTSLPLRLTRSISRHMINSALFDRRYGKGAFDRLRSMLDDPTLTYEGIAKNLGLTKQRIGQLAADFGLDGRQREHERVVCRSPRITRKNYPPAIAAVVRKIMRSGFQVQPYNSMQRTPPRVGRAITEDGACERLALQHSSSQGP